MSEHDSTLGEEEIQSSPAMSETPAEGDTDGTDGDSDGMDTGGGGGSDSDGTDSDSDDTDT
jgi:hypothetical protein